MTFEDEFLANQIPYYLVAAPKQKAIVRELRSLMGGARKGYFLTANADFGQNEMLQGDGWPGFQLFSFESGKKLSVRGIVISNSCDISPENERYAPPKITFAPITKLSSIGDIMKNRGYSAAQVEARLDAIRSQSATSYFYLPEDGPLGEEYVALLGDLHSMPVGSHIRQAKIFTLSMAGFYLFVFKLSVHFCRFHEDVNRGVGAERDARSGT